MKNFKLGCILLIAIFMCSCASSENSKEKFISIKDSTGSYINISKKATKIVSMAPNITEILFALGVGENIIARTNYCDYPKEAQQIQKIGGIQNPNIEKIVELKPDIVIASTHMKDQDIKKLKSLNIAVAIFYDEKNFENVYEIIKNISILVGKEKKSELVIKKMKNEVEEAKNIAKNSKKPKVYYMISYGKMGDYTAGGDTFIGKMLDFSGAENIAKDTKGWQFNIENLLQKNPEKIIVPKNQGIKEALKKLSPYKELDAVKNDKIYEIDNNLLDRQGPRISKGLLKLAKIMRD